MMAPPTINARSYKSIFTFAVISDLDGSTTYGRIVDAKEIPDNNQTQEESID